MAVKEGLKNIEADHPELAKTFSTGWHMPLSSYGKNLYRKDALQPEQALLNALEAELRSMGQSADQVQQIKDQLQHLPVLQTTHHITPTHGPTFLALDLICLSALESPIQYLVAANSGVSFSNSAWSGALSFGDLPLENLVDSSSHLFQQAIKSQRERMAHGDTDHRISLIPARQRDRLVYGSTITDFQVDIAQQFSQPLKAILPEMEPGQPFSHWSADAASRIQNRIFNTEQVLVFDINRVINRYLVEILTHQPEHPCCELLFNSTVGADIRATFNDPTMFLGLYRGKKSEKVNSLTWTGSGLKSPKTGFQKLEKSELIQMLSDNKLCPGIFLLFFILRFLNRIRCLGSFSQISYLEDFRKKWQTVDVDWQLDLKPDYLNALTTGRLIRDKRAIWPLDLAMKGDGLAVASFANMEMGELWEPIVHQLSRLTGKASS